MSTLTATSEHIVILPSQVIGKTCNMDNGSAILDVIASCIRAMDYLPPSVIQDPTLKERSLKELYAWDVGETLDGTVIKYLDTAIIAAELFYPSHETDLRIIVAICTTCMLWIDEEADTIIEALEDFQRRFHSRLPQLHPVLSRYAAYMLKLYDHYETYSANAMIMSICAFIDANCLEWRTLTKRVPTKMDAKLWPDYVRNLSGIAAFYSFACFPKKDHPDLGDYIHAIPEMLIFTNFMNDVPSFYKEEINGEQHNYIQTMSRLSSRPPINVLEDISHEVVSVTKRAERILKDSPVALRAYQDYERGYIRFHIDVDRYRFPADWKAQFNSD